jgi:hypothetical protein
MPRFYFHLLNDVDAPDEEGQVLRDLDEAREYARRSVLFTMAETIKEKGHLVKGHRVDIEDEHGNVLDAVYFRDVVSIEE